MPSLPVLVTLLSMLHYSTQFFAVMSDLSISSNLARSPIVNISSTSGHFQEVDFNLSDHQWQHRLVLVFAPSERSLAYQQQMRMWQADMDGICDRHLKLVEVLGTGASRIDGQPITATAAERLRQQFGLTTNDFVVILVGKDGTSKQHSQTPVDLVQLFHTIDAMPMRRQEMRQPK